MIEKLEKYLKRQKYNKCFNGCSYYILCNKEKFIGNVGEISNKPIKIDNIIDIIVINMIICRLMDEKELNLQTKVNKYIEDLKYDDILIMHLLTHSSGLVNKIDNKKFEAGTDVKINGINYHLLKEIIEKVYNTNIELLARSFIFEPLNMFDTKLVKNHVCTTINDLSHFVDMILNDGYYNKKQIIDKKYIDLWFTPLFTDGTIRTTIGWTFGPSTKVCSGIDYTLSTIIFDKKNLIVVDRDNEYALVLLFNDLKEDIRNNICKYIFKLLKEENKIY